MGKNLIPLAIKTCLKNKDRQQAIKNTWLQSIDRNVYYPLFLIADINLKQNYILDGDILYVKADDTYRGLSGKMKMYYEWALFNTNSTHFWSVDDDSYINCKLFNNNFYLLYDYIGAFIYGTAKINDRSGYTSGCGTCISRICAKYCADNLPHKADNDDIEIGNIINKYIFDVKKFNDTRIHPWSYCNYIPNLMIGHYIHKMDGGAPHTRTFDESMKIMHSYYAERNDL